MTERNRPVAWALVAMCLTASFGCGAQDAFWFGAGYFAGVNGDEGEPDNACVSDAACGDGLACLEGVCVDAAPDVGDGDDSDGTPVDNGSTDDHRNGPPDNRPPDHAGPPSDRQPSGDADGDSDETGTDSVGGVAEPNGNGGGMDEARRLICHHPDRCPEPGHAGTIEVNANAVSAHIGHGDVEGACDE